MISKVSFCLIFFLVIILFNSIIKTVDFPTAGLWTGIRPLERKVKLLNEYCTNGSIDYLILGSSIADFGFSAKEFSNILSENLNRNIKAFNFSSGGAELTFVRKLLNFASLTCKFNNILILFPLQGKHELEYSPGYPDSILRDAPVGKYIDNSFFLKISKFFFFETFLNLTSMLRDQLLYRYYKSLVGGYDDNVNMSPNGDLEALYIKAYRQTMKNDFENLAANLNFFPNPTPGSKSIHLSELHIKNMRQILNFAKSEGSKVIFVPIDQYVGYIDKRTEMVLKKKLHHESYAKYFDVESINILSEFEPFGYDFADSVHLNYFGSLKFANLLAMRMTNQIVKIATHDFSIDKHFDFLDRLQEQHKYPDRRMVKVIRLGQFNQTDKLKCYFLKNQFNPVLPPKMKIYLVSDDNIQLEIFAQELEDGGYLAELNTSSTNEKYYFVELKDNQIYKNAYIQSCSLQSEKN